MNPPLVIRALPPAAKPPGAVASPARQAAAKPAAAGKPAAPAQPSAAAKGGPLPSAGWGNPYPKPVAARPGLRAAPDTTPDYAVQLPPGRMGDGIELINFEGTKGWVVGVGGDWSDCYPEPDAPFGSVEWSLQFNRWFRSLPPPATIYLWETRRAEIRLADKVLGWALDMSDQEARAAFREEQQREAAKRTQEAADAAQKKAAGY